MENFFSSFLNSLELQEYSNLWFNLGYQHARSFPSPSGPTRPTPHAPCVFSLSHFSNSSHISREAIREEEREGVKTHNKNNNNLRLTYVLGPPPTKSTPFDHHCCSYFLEERGGGETSLLDQPRPPFTSMPLWLNLTWLGIP